MAKQQPGRARMTPKQHMRAHATKHRLPPAPEPSPQPAADVVKAAADIRAEAIRVKAAADAKKAAADAVHAEAERLRIAHETTVAERERLLAEHVAADTHAQQLAEEADARAAAEHAAKPWHQRLLGR